MFFVVSKVFWTLVQPLTLVFLLLLAGWLLTLLGRRRLGLTAGGLGLILLAVASFTSLGTLLIAPLEDRFTRPVRLPDAVDTIVMLGGATDGTISTARQITELSDAGDRLTDTLQLALRYPDARILITGGSGRLVAEGESEAEIAARFFAGIGIAADRLLLEAASRNTDENAELTKAMLGEDPGTVVLVTSAFHMPRSIGLFRRVGIDVLPWPTDYRSAGSPSFAFELVNPVQNLETVGVAVKEWIGLAVYHWTGRIEEPFPAQVSN
ncbi:MAG TPA: YdcF family protein [Devosia sp.]|jgi:uncharacterized SAM-binding protein YcdF (DUF218 family)|nr:YdcF family protein [Devosia sp.]